MKTLFNAGCYRLTTTKKTTKGFIKTIIQSVIELLICKAIVFIIYIISNIPFPPIKIALFVVSLIPYSILLSVVFTIIHIFINIYNNINICKYCSSII